MIGNKLEQSIIEVFQEDFTKTYSINEISKKLKKSYPYIHKKANYFLKEGIIKKINIGHSFQCFLNLKDEKTQIFLSINELNKREEYKRKEQHLAISKGIDQALSEVNIPIETVVIYKDEIIFVLEDIKHTQIIEEKLQLEKIKLVFFNRETFQNYILNITGKNTDFVIYHNISTYLDILAEISEKLLVKGIVK